MKTEEWKAQLMDYLYDEMEDPEKKLFEAELARNPALQAELDSLKSDKDILANLQDEEVNAPPFLRTSRPQVKNQSGSGIKWFMAVAASIALLLFAGKFTGLEISNAEGKFRMAFNSEQQPVETIKKADIQKLISNSLANYERQLDTKRSKEMEQLLAANREDNKKLINTYMKSMVNTNTELMRAYWQESNEQQKIYVESMLTDFTAYMQQQRKEDMDYLFAKMELIESDKDLFKLETGQILNTLASNAEQETAY